MRMLHWNIDTPTWTEKLWSISQTSFHFQIVLFQHQFNLTIVIEICCSECSLPLAPVAAFLSSPNALIFRASKNNFCLWQVLGGRFTVSTPRISTHQQSSRKIEGKNKTSWWFQPLWKMNISQINLPQIGVNIINIWHHHLEKSQVKILFVFLC